MIDHKPVSDRLRNLLTLPVGRNGFSNSVSFVLVVANLSCAEHFSTCNVKNQFKFLSKTNSALQKSESVIYFWKKVKQFKMLLSKKHISVHQICNIAIFGGREIINESEII